MHTRPTTGLAATILGLSLLGVSPASAMGIEGDHLTAVSGFPGIAGESFTLGLGDDGITEIRWWEQANRPCSIEIRGRDPDEPDDGFAWAFDRRNFCNDPEWAGNVKGINVTDHPRWYVRGIATCSNDQTNHRMKGLAAVVAKLPVNSLEVEPLVEYEDDRHANCADWNEWVYCPADQVAKGLNVRVKDGSIVGLGLICGTRELDD